MNIDMSKLKGSQIAEAILDFRGSRVEFGDNYGPQRKIYDTYEDYLVLKASRQVGKSLGLAGRINIGSVAQPWFQSLYITPSQIQTKRFSSGYLDIFRDCDYISKYCVDQKDVGNVFQKTYKNKSTVYLSYAQTGADADRVRGLTADLMCIDEVQDVSMDIIPVIGEILNTSQFGYQMFTGTSKSTANTLEQLWQLSNKQEWVKKCDKCGKWVIPHDFDTCMEMCINPKHMVCPHCHNRFDFFDGQWVKFNEKDRVGLHLPQLIFGANISVEGETGDRKPKWPQLYKKVEDSLKGGLYTPATLANEVFGLATDMGASSLSLGEAQACSDPEWREWPLPDGSNVPAHLEGKIGNIHSTILGVDWSVSGSESSSTVAVVIGICHDNSIVLLDSKKYADAKIHDQVAQVGEMANKWNVKCISSDRGVGVLQGEILQQRFGHNRAIMTQYVSSDTMLYWNTKGNYLAADRTRAMDNIMTAMRWGPERFLAPCWEETEYLWNDALAIYEEETRVGKRLYVKDPNIPDDWFHAVTFAYLGYQYTCGHFERFVE